jgi:hypothetical protein
MATGMSSSETLEVGIVVERRKLNNPWQQWSWRAVALAPAIENAQAWKVLNQSEGWTRFYAGALRIELHRTATASYRDNLSVDEPQVYVILRADSASADFPYRAFLATVAPDEAQSHLESGDDIVDAVPMPAEIVAWVASFIERHHVETPVYKRQRKPHDPRKGPPPPGAPSALGTQSVQGAPDVKARAPSAPGGRPGS